MIIPKSFCLFGSKYTVEIEDDLLNRRNSEGFHSYREKKLLLQKVIPGHNEEAQEHAFLHELTHAILTQMNEWDKNDSEKFVDVFSGLLHQALKTMED